MEEDDYKERQPYFSRRFVKWGSYVALGTLAYMGLASIVYVATPHEEEPLQYKPEVVAAAPPNDRPDVSSRGGSSEGDDGIAAVGAIAILGGLSAGVSYVAWRSCKAEVKARPLEPFSVPPRITQEQMPDDSYTALHFAAIVEHMVWDEDAKTLH